MIILMIMMMCPMPCMYCFVRTFVYNVNRLERGRTQHKEKREEDIPSPSYLPSFFGGNVIMPTSATKRTANQNLDSHLFSSNCKWVFLFSVLLGKTKRCTTRESNSCFFGHNEVYFVGLKLSNRTTIRVVPIYFVAGQLSKLVKIRISAPL